MNAELKAVADKYGAAFLGGFEAKPEGQALVHPYNYAKSSAELIAMKDNAAPADITLIGNGLPENQAGA